MPVCNTKNCENKVGENKVGSKALYCRTHYKQRYTQERRAEITLYHKQYRLVTKQRVFEHYGNKCACCGENTLDFLTIDHVNNDGNLEKWPAGRRRSGNGLHTKIIKAGFPNTFQLLCMNCNWGKKWSGVCPHALVVV